MKEETAEERAYRLAMEKIELEAQLQAGRAMLAALDDPSKIEAANYAVRHAARVAALTPLSPEQLRDIETVDEYWKSLGISAAERESGEGQYAYMVDLLRVQSGKRPQGIKRSIGYRLGKFLGRRI